MRFVDPGEGYLACGWIGKGRLAEPVRIAEAAHGLLQPSGSLLGRLVVVSAGPTYEDIDPVRYIGNRSSGKMGYALAAEAARRGARVVLVSGPSSQTAPQGIELVQVRGAREMQAAVLMHAKEAEIVDHGRRRRRLHAGGRCCGREDREDRRSTYPDARANARHPGRPWPIAAAPPPFPSSSASLPRAAILSGVGARSSTRNPPTSSSPTTSRNRDRGFDSDMNAATLISAESDEAVPLGTKADLAARILDRAERLLERSDRGARTRQSSQS